MKNTLSLNNAFAQIEALASTFQSFEKLVLEFQKWSNTHPKIYACAYCGVYNVSADAPTLEELTQKLQMNYEHTLLQKSVSYQIPDLVLAEPEAEELLFEAKSPYEF
jgi:hypothetical protein